MQRLKINIFHIRSLHLVLILFMVRILDLTITFYSSHDFINQEQHFLVKDFNISFYGLIIFELGFYLLLVILYFVSLKHIKEITFFRAFYKFLISLRLRHIFIILLYLLPYMFIVVGVLACINNLWVYSYMQGNLYAIKSYNLLDEFYFFDLAIMISPFLILMVLTKLYHTHLGSLKRT